MTNPADFHALTRRLRLTGTLLTRTALRIGGTGTGALDGADLPVLRDGEGFPFIPGASLKGALRSTIEALVRGVGLAELWACDPHAENELAKQGACGFHKSNNRKQAEQSTDAHCAVCRLFGSRVLASHVRISDALVSRAHALRRPPIEVRDGVAIDRDLGVVFRGQKYDFEVITPGIYFDLELFIDNPQDWQLGLLLLGLDQISDGFTALGGFSSRGLGRVELAWSELHERTASDLFTNAPGRTLGPGDMGTEFSRWRDALAGHATRSA